MLVVLQKLLLLSAARLIEQLFRILKIMIRHMGFVCRVGSHI